MTKALQIWLFKKTRPKDPNVGADSVYNGDENLISIMNWSFQASDANATKIYLRVT